MSVEIPINDNSEGTKSTNGTSTDHVNGMQNGYSSSEKHKSGHKSSSKDKYRDKDRHRDAERNRNGSSKHSSSSGRDKDKHSSSKDHHRSSHKSSSKDKDRSDKDKHRSEKEKVRSDRGEGDRNKEIDRNKESYKNKESDRKDKDRHSQTHDKYRNSDKDKDGKSSSRSEHRSSSSKDHKSSKSSHDKHRSDKDKHRHSSSSSKDKQHSSSRDKTDSKEKSSHNNEKDKQLSQPQARSSVKEEITELTRTKEEIHSVTEDSVVKKEKNTWETNPPNGDFLSSTVSSCDYSLSQFKDEPLDDVKMEVESEEDVPLAARADKKRKAAPSDSDEEEKPLSIRKINKAKKPKVKKKESDYDEDSEEEPKSKKKSVPLKTKDVKEVTPVKRKKKQEEAPEVWKWWEEEKKQDGTKWSYLEHKGPLFAPEYEKLPKDVVFRYDSKVIKLSEETEEVAGFYARMLDHDYTTKSVFNDNFFQDWRKVMTSDERSMIKDLKKCDFKSMHVFFKNQSEKNRNRTKEEKLALKTKNEEIQKEYGFCTIDGHNEKIGNFRIEPPGLFRGRGEHPKMGMLKKRVIPEHVLINCSKDSKIPKAPDGHRWKEVRHDNTVTWLASWTENVQGQVKYVMLNPSSKLKGEKDWQKYEIARKLHKSINGIRDTYVHEWKAKEMRVRQRAVALYFIDKLALRAGNEKDEDQADTVGCCSLRVEHIELHKELNGKEYVVVFDFLGKDSIRYYNEVEVEKRVFKNLELFKENKKDGDDLFDRLNTQILNEHLRALMPGLTAKVFRTYNASITLQNQLDELTDPDYSPAEKILAYNRANRAVAILCNHQRAVPKGHQKSMESLKEKINQKHEQIDEAESELKDLQRMAKRGSVKEKFNADKKKKSLEKLREQLKKLEVQETDRDENKTIALGTSKLNYLDPRISVAWCKKYDVPLEKIYNKTQRDKFRWAIDMADADYIF